MTVEVADVHAGRREELLGLIREADSHAVSSEELDWLFDRNPLGPRIVSVAEDGGRVVGLLAMLLGRAIVDGKEERIAFAVRAVTHPAARGRGVFSRLELHNEDRAAAAGAALALGFTNRLAGPILVGKLGWRDLYRMRIWVRPLRGLRRARGGAERLERFTDAQERAWLACSDRWGNCLVRDAAYLNWRYADAPAEYRAFAAKNGYAVVGHAVRGVSASVVCDLVGPPAEQRQLLRSCLQEARDAAVAIGVPAPGQRPAYLALGFVPSPRTIRVIGKPLRPDGRLPSRWHFSLGDTDFL